MRAKITFAAAILMAGTLFSAAAAPMTDQWTRPQATRGLTVWADVEFRGADHTFIDDAPDITSTGLARMISSLRPGPGETWQVCTSPNYGGRCRIFSSAVVNMHDIGWNDVVMSVRRLSGSGYGSQAPQGRALPTPTGLELYSGTNYTGSRLVLRQATNDLRTLNFNDVPMSVRVPPNQSWEICVHIDYDQCRVITDDIPDLNRVGMAKMITAARPANEAGAARNRGFYQGRGQQKQLENARLIVFEGANFTGRRVTITEERTSLLGTAGSIQVVGGRWQLCDRADFGGNCVMVNNDVANIGDLNLRGRVASLRPR
jgi:hypothetical protein